MKTLLVSTLLLAANVFAQTPAKPTTLTDVEQIVLQEVESAAKDADAAVDKAKLAVVDATAKRDAAFVAFRKALTDALKAKGCKESDIASQSCGITKAVADGRTKLTFVPAPVPAPGTAK